MSDIPDLWNLSLRVANLTDDHSAELSDVEGLTSLDLTMSEVVTDISKRTLSRLTKLSPLNLDATSVTDAGLALLAGHPAMSRLSISWKAVTDAGSAAGGQVSNLTSLGINDTTITGAGFADLAGVTMLREMGMMNAPVTNAGIAHLAEIPSLEWIFASRTQSWTRHCPSWRGCPRWKRFTLTTPGFRTRTCRRWRDIRHW